MKSMKSTFRRWIDRVSRRLNPISNIDEALRQLKPHPALQGDFVTTFLLRGQRIELIISPDDQQIEDCIAIAQTVLETFGPLNKTALTIASDRLLGSYNSDWRLFSTLNEDGTLKHIEKPKLSVSAFHKTLRLSSIAIVGLMVEFVYADGDLFGGHSIIVQSFDGVQFDDTHVDLFG